MFSALRQNSIVYILDKTGTINLKKGLVVSVTAPRPKIGGVYSNPLDMVVDITVSSDGKQEEFKNIPAGLTVANDSNMVLTETKEAMCLEVEATLALSKLTLESVPYHKQVVSACEEMLKDLNPQYAKEREQEAKISALESKIGGIESSLGDMKEMLTKALNKTV